MATFDYEGMQALADELITEFGQSGTISRTASPDPIEGGDPVPQSYPAKLVPISYDQKFVDGTNITTADRQLYISSVGLAIEPAPGDIVSASGKSYLIIAGDPNNYDGVTNVVFIVQGRIV